MARLEPTASMSSAVGLVRGHVSLLVRLSSLLEQIAEVLKVIQQCIVETIVDEPVLAEFVGVWEQIGAVPVPQTTDDFGEGVSLAPQEHLQNRTQEEIVDVPFPPILEAPLDVVRSTPQERVQNRTQEQIVDSPVPQFLEAAVEVVPSTPQESVQNRVGEKIMDSPVPQFMDAVVEVLPSLPQERVQNRIQEKIMDFPVPRNMEAVVEVGRATPQERVQNPMQDQIVDMPAHLITEKIVADVFGLPQERVQNRATCTGKVFTVRHRDDQACTVDNVGFIKGLAKHNIPRLGDVMVSAAQITKGIVGHVEQVVSWFDRKSQVAPDEPLYRFQKSARAAAAAPSSNGEWLRFQQIGVGPVLGPGY